MFRIILFASCAMLAVAARAQDATNKVKATEKQGDTQIDYKVTGMPLPPVRIIVYDDTAAMKVDQNAGKETGAKHRGKKHHKEETTQVLGQPHRLHGVLTNKELDNGANLFLMIFNPTCSHCEDETMMLEQHIDLFHKSNFILMATPVVAPYLSDFFKFTRLKDYPQFTVGVDSTNYLDKVFLYRSLPQINIYDKHQKLLKIYSGEVSIDSLKQYIE